MASAVAEGSAAVGAVAVSGAEDAVGVSGRDGAVGSGEVTATATCVSRGLVLTELRNRR